MESRGGTAPGLVISARACAPGLCRGLWAIGCRRLWAFAGPGPGAGSPVRRARPSRRRPGLFLTADAGAQEQEQERESHLGPRFGTGAVTSAAHSWLKPVTRQPEDWTQVLGKQAPPLGGRSFEVPLQREAGRLNHF